MCSIARFWPRRRPWHRSASGSTGCGETSRIPFLFCRAIFSMLWCRPRRCGPVVAVTVAFFFVPPLFFAQICAQGWGTRTSSAGRWAWKQTGQHTWWKDVTNVYPPGNMAATISNVQNYVYLRRQWRRRCRCCQFCFRWRRHADGVPGRRAKLLGNWLEKAVAKYKFPRDWGF